MTGDLRVLVLGGYGLIGQAVVRRLLGDGCRVTGLARDAGWGRRLLPAADWIGADIARLTTPADWLPLLGGVDAVVNAAGALQTGLRDDVLAVQQRAMLALIVACEHAGIRRLVQISAVGASEHAGTLFMRSKGAGDAALAASSVPHVILRPGLVIAPTAYGGTALLRALAAVPVVQPLVLGPVPVQCVGVDDLAAAVSRALTDERLLGQAFDLVEPVPRSLADTVLAFRRWLGFAPPVVELCLPAWLGRLVAAGADLAGWLGWRSPLRSTALAVLAEGVTGDAGPWRRRTGETFPALDRQLAVLPSTPQERRFARLYLLLPVLVLAAALFWLISGLIGCWQFERARALLVPALGAPWAGGAVVAGAVADILIGLGLLWRRLTRPAAFVSIIVACGYLLGATVWLPDLWADPLGPLVKVIPALALALVIAALIEER